MLIFIFFCSGIDSGIITSNAIGKKSSLIIPKSWSFSVLDENEESIVVFSHTIIKIKNNVKIPITDKNIVISGDKTLRYFVCGHVVATKEHELSEILDNVRLLPQLLELFQKLTVCNGLL